MPKKMRLWTIHKNGAFSLTDGSVDHSRSEYYMSIPAVREAYPQLWRHLGLADGQIIWCYTRREDIPDTDTAKRIWEIEVGTSSVLAYIDDVVWNRILRIRVPLTPRYRKPIREEAARRFPDHSQARREYEKKLEQRFWDRRPPEGKLWRELFLDKPADGSSALIRHPLQEEWIVQEGPQGQALKRT